MERNFKRISDGLKLPQESRVFVPSLPPTKNNRRTFL